MQGTRVRALVWEDPTCHGAARPVSQLLSLRVWSLCSATGEAAIVRGPRTAMKSGPRLPQLEKALAQKRRPNTAKNKNKINKLKKKVHLLSSTFYYFFLSFFFLVLELTGFWLSSWCFIHLNCVLWARFSSPLISAFASWLHVLHLCLPGFFFIHLGPSPENFLQGRKKKRCSWFDFWCWV